MVVVFPFSFFVEIFSEKDKVKQADDVEDIVSC